MYKKTTLPNKLRVITHDIKDRESIALGFWIGVGGRYETDPLKGVAHFLEHIAFKGSQKYSCEEIKELIEGVGGTLNAFTSEEQTCFYAKIPAKHLEQTFDVLADMVFFPKIDQSDVEKESTVIIEEIKMYHDLPQYFVSELLDDLLWPNHPLGKSLTGTEKTVSSMTNKDLRGFHDRYYNPGNVVVSACGRLKHDQIVDLTRKKLAPLKGGKRHDFIEAENVQSSPRVKFYKKDIEQMHLAFGAIGYDEFHKDRYAMSLLSIILGGNMSSRLFVEVREKRGLAYSISSSSKTLHDTGVVMVRAGVDNKKIIDATELIFKEISKIKKEGITDKNEFTRAKEYLLGQVLLGLEDTMDHMLWLGEAIIAKNKVKTLPEVVRSFNKVTPEDVHRVACEILDQKKYNLAIIGPLTDSQEKSLSSLVGVR